MELPDTGVTSQKWVPSNRVINSTQSSD